MWAIQNPKYCIQRNTHVTPTEIAKPIRSRRRGVFNCPGQGRASCKNKAVAASYLHTQSASAALLSGVGLNPPQHLGLDSSDRPCRRGDFLTVRLERLRFKRMRDWIAYEVVALFHDGSAPYTEWSPEPNLELLSVSIHIPGHAGTDPVVLAQGPRGQPGHGARLRLPAGRAPLTSTNTRTTTESLTIA